MLFKSCATGQLSQLQVIVDLNAIPAYDKDRKFGLKPRMVSPLFDFAFAFGFILRARCLGYFGKSSTKLPCSLDTLPGYQPRDLLGTYSAIRSATSTV